MKFFTKALGSAVTATISCDAYKIQLSNFQGNQICISQSHTISFQRPGSHASYSANRLIKQPASKKSSNLEYGGPLIHEFKNNPIRECWPASSKNWPL